MDERQKSIIWKMLLTIIVVASITMLVLALLYYTVLNNTKVGGIIGIVTGVISPTTIFGIVVKMVINKKQRNNIDNLLIERGVIAKQVMVETKVDKKSKKVYSMDDIDYVLKNGQLIIIDTKERSQLEFTAILERDFINVIEQLRKNTH